MTAAARAVAAAVFHDEDLIGIIIGHTSERLMDLASGLYRPGGDSMVAEVAWARERLRRTIRFLTEAMALCKSATDVCRKERTRVVAELADLFGDMRRAGIQFLLAEPERFAFPDRLAPGVPSTNAVRVWSHLHSGKKAIAPLRLVYEACMQSEPLVPPTLLNQNIFKTIMDHNHWTRNHVLYTIMTVPPADVRDLWRCLGRGCAVCGTRCRVVDRRVTLSNACQPTTWDATAHHGTSVRPNANANASAFTKQSMVVINPWDHRRIDPEMATSLAIEKMAFRRSNVMDLTTFLCSRQLPYTHATHAVGLRFIRRGALAKAGDESKGFNVAYCENALGSESTNEYRVATENLLFALRRRPSWQGWIRERFQARMASVRAAGIVTALAGAMGAEEDKADAILDCNAFGAVLPLRAGAAGAGLLPNESWQELFGLSDTEMDAMTLPPAGHVWKTPVPQVTRTGIVTSMLLLERWRARELQHIWCVLAERMAPPRTSAFARSTPTNEDDDASWVLCKPRILNHQAGDASDRPLCTARNLALLEAYKPAALLTQAVSERTDPKHIEILRTVFEADRRSPSYNERMIEFLLRLDAIVGVAWRHAAAPVLAFDKHQLDLVDEELLALAVDHIRNTPIAPPFPGPSPTSDPRLCPDMPPGPSNSDTLLRWLLAIIVNGGAVEFQCVNAFLPKTTAEAHSHGLDPTAVVLRAEVNVHLTLCVATTRKGPASSPPRTVRIAMGISMAHLDRIHRQLCDHAIPELSAFETEEEIYCASGMRPRNHDPLPIENCVRLSTGRWRRVASTRCAQIEQWLKGNSGRNPQRSIKLLHELLKCPWSALNRADAAPQYGHFGVRALCERGRWFCDITTKDESFCEAMGYSQCFCALGCAFRTAAAV